MKSRRNTISLTTFIVFLLLAGVTKAQSGEIEVQCGTILDGEFRENSESHIYRIEMAAGDKFTVNVMPLGETLATNIVVFGPTAIRVTRSERTTRYSLATVVDVMRNPVAETPQLSASGKYLVHIANSDMNISNGDVFDSGTGGIGVYTLNIGCTLRDNRVINPGDIIQPTVPTLASSVDPVPLPSAPVRVTFGFPGLPSVDFSTAVLLPFTLGQFNNGQIPPAANTIIGYTFTGNAGQVFDLSFLRPTGNLNLGLVVLSPTNKVIFQTSLITSDLLATRFTLRESGQHTIGVFPISLDPPAAPEITSFQINGTLT